MVNVADGWRERNIETKMDIYAEVTDTKKHESIQDLAHKLDVF